MKFYCEDHIIALQTFLADAPRSAKRDAIARATMNGASDRELDYFLTQPQSVNTFLEFVSTVDARRAELPLFVRNHIRHLLRNPVLAAASNLKAVSTEPRVPSVSTQCLPGTLSYVMVRLGEGESLLLTSGWTLESEMRRQEITRAYLCYAVEQGVRCVWRSGAQVVATMYAGMGHFYVLAAAPDGTFFRFIDGGANGHDRKANFEDAAKLSTHLIAEMRVPWQHLLG